MLLSVENFMASREFFGPIENFLPVENFFCLSSFYLVGKVHWSATSSVQICHVVQNKENGGHFGCLCLYGTLSTIKI